MQESEKVQHVLIKMYRSSDRLTVAAPLPGMEPEDIFVQVTDDGHLIIRGKVRGLLKDVKELLIDEWSVGAYFRDVQLPVSVDGEGANVTYGNGVMVVALPLSNQVIPATLRLSKVGTARGEHTGNAGHPAVLTK
jgi:HSP20 family protein